MERRLCASQATPGGPASQSWARGLPDRIDFLGKSALKDVSCSSLTDAPLSILPAHHRLPCWRPFSKKIFKVLRMKCSCQEEYKTKNAANPKTAAFPHPPQGISIGCWNLIRESLFTWESPFSWQ